MKVDVFRTLDISHPRNRTLLAELIGKGFSFRPSGRDSSAPVAAPAAARPSRLKRRKKFTRVRKIEGDIARSILRLREQGVDSVSIAKTVGLSYSGVRNWLSRQAQEATA